MPVAQRIALQIWNLLGGAEWSGFVLACEMYGVTDHHEMALLLAAIRDTQHDIAERKINRSP